LDNAQTISLPPPDVLLPMDNCAYGYGGLGYDVAGAYGGPTPAASEDAQPNDPQTEIGE
jgi:hypothetical protein